MQLKLCIHRCLHSPFGYLVGMLLDCCGIAPAVQLFLAASASPAAARQCANRLWLRPAPVPRWAPAAGCGSRLAARPYPAGAWHLAPPRAATPSVRVRAAGSPPRRMSSPGAGARRPRALAGCCDATASRPQLGAGGGVGYFNDANKSASVPISL